MEAQPIRKRSLLKLNPNTRLSRVKVPNVRTLDIPQREKSLVITVYRDGSFEVEEDTRSSEKAEKQRSQIVEQIEKHNRIE